MASRLQADISCSPISGKCVYVIRKVWIGTILGLSCTKFGSELCTYNPRIVWEPSHPLPMLCTCTFNILHVYVGFCTLVGEWHITILQDLKWAKETFLSRKKVGSNVSLLLIQGDNHLSIKTSLLHLYYRCSSALLGRSIFDHNFSIVLFLVRPHFAKFLAYCTFLIDTMQ